MRQNFYFSSTTLTSLVADLRALLPRESLLNETAPATFKKYNEDQMIQVEVNGKKTLISKYAEIGANEYHDAANKQAFTFDHIKQEVSNVRPENGASNALRDGLEQAAMQYTREHYPSGTCGVFLKGSDIFICISAARFNNQNFWYFLSSFLSLFFFLFV